MKGCLVLKELKINCQSLRFVDDFYKQFLCEKKELQAELGNSLGTIFIKKIIMNLVGIM